jgi:hypothetical protein
MSKVYRTVLDVCWALGLISMVGSFVVKLLPISEGRLGVTVRGGLMLAGVLFLCVLATGEVRKAPPSS